VIILDTNVISELMRSQANRGVLIWIASLDPRDIFTTTVSQAEILAGVALLPDGKRKESIAFEAARLFSQIGTHSVLPSDNDAAREYADIVAVRTRMGRPIQTIDAQIAAVARSRRATLSTRNARDFADCGVTLINPWD
jgi:predicted nucleic acid-binding protein